MPYVPPSLAGSVVKNAVKSATGVNINEFSSSADEENPKDRQDEKAAKEDYKRDAFLMSVTIIVGALALIFGALAVYIEYR